MFIQQKPAHDWSQFNDQEFTSLMAAVFCYLRESIATGYILIFARSMVNESISRNIRLLLTCPLCKGQGITNHLTQLPCNLCHKAKEIPMIQCLQFHESVSAKECGVQQFIPENDSGADSKIVDK